jgi:hypothetical protein
MYNINKFLSFGLALIVSFALVACSEDIDVKTESSINYTLTMSPDLLKFVTPQVSYVDENGNLIVLTGVEELDGKVIENQAEISQKSGGTEVYASGWTQQVVTGTGYKCWTFQMKFNRLNFHSYMGVKYLRNDFVEDTSGKVYDFHHSINTSIIALKSTITEKHSLFGSTQSVDSKAYSDTHLSISLKDYRKGDDVEEYLRNLTANPDKAGYYVDDNGDVTRRDDFPL